MASAIRILRRRFDTLESAPQTLIDDLPKFQGQFEKQVNELLKRLSTKGGKIVWDKNTAKALNLIEQGIRDYVHKSPYRSAVTEFLTSFDTIKKANVEYFRAASGFDAAKLNLNLLQEQAMDAVNYNLVDNGLDARFTQPIKDILRGGAASGQSVVEAERLLDEFIMGSKGELGFFERYVPQIAHDSIGQYDGMIQTQVKIEFGLNAWSYEGSLIKTSRPQCIRWVGKGIIKEKNLESEIAWAFTNGSGMIPSTDAATFGVNRGGFRCRHRATAIKV